MQETRRLLRHQLATLAYRTQKALRGAPVGFGAFAAGAGVRTPHELLNHMTNLIGYTVHALVGDDPVRLDPCDDFGDEVARFHERLRALSELFANATFEREELAERLLQGPLSDAMTHVGQLALLRRLAGAPIDAENFFRAPIHRENVSIEQP